MIFDSDSIGDFASELEAPAAASRQGGDRSVSLQEIVSRETRVSWEEAVAIVEELCSLLVSDTDATAPVPALADVRIDAQGALMLPRFGHGEDSPEAAGRVLHALLATSEVPVALRLFVSQATASDTHASLKEFASGLAYFGKPGRAALIRAVFERHVAEPASLPAPRPVPIRHAAPPPAVPPRSVAAVPRREQRAPAWLLPAGAAFAVAVVALGAWLWSMEPGSTSEVDAAGDAVATTVGAPSEGTPPPADVAPVNASPASTARQTPPRAAGTAPRSTAASAPANARSADAVSTEAGDTTASRPPAGPRSFSLPPVQETPRRAAVVETPASALEVTRTVYSAADTDVQPPVLLDQQMPRPLVTAGPGSAATINTMELLIAPDGTVERARMIAGPGRMPDMMLLSGAKMWKFTPATKDGEPVRYRTLLSWEAFP